MSPSLPSAKAEDPPAPDLVHALVTGTSPILRALDTQARQPAKV